VGGERTGREVGGAEGGGVVIGRGGVSSFLFLKFLMLSLSLIFLGALIYHSRGCAERIGGARKPHHDGTLGGTVVAAKRTICVHCHDLYRSHAINEVTKKKKDSMQ